MNGLAMATGSIRWFGDCADHRGPENIAQLMEDKLRAVYNGEEEHVSVRNDDGIGQHVVVFIMSDSFKGMLPIARHRAVNEIIKDEIKHVHALQIDAKTLEQLAKTQMPDAKDIKK